MDRLFIPVSRSYHLNDAPEDNKPYSSTKHLYMISWQRITDKRSEKFNEASLWGPDGKASFDESSQGYLGDFWLIAAISSIAENSSRIQNMFVT